MVNPAVHIELAYYTRFMLWIWLYKRIPSQGDR